MDTAFAEMVREGPVILCDDWTPVQLKAFRLLVNRSVTSADWVEEIRSLRQPMRIFQFGIKLYF
jgi:hypothetical protein